MVGHPKSNSPAYGWTGKLEYEDGNLYAELEQVNADFLEAVKSGAYKNRSISLYPDGRLRHIGFLGATPPAIKGLEEVNFSEDKDVVTYEFGESNDSSDGASTSDKDSYEADKADFDNTKKRLAEFEEAITAKEAEIKRLQETIRAKEDEEKRLKIESFVDKQIDAGRLAPGQRELVVNIGLVCAKVRNYDFSEEIKKSADEFEAFISSLPVVVEFKEFATQDRVGETTDFSDPKSVAEKAKKYQAEQAKAGKKISMAQAVAHITTEEKR